MKYLIKENIIFFFKNRKNFEFGSQFFEKNDFKLFLFEQSFENGNFSKRFFNGSSENGRLKLHIGNCQTERYRHAQERNHALRTSLSHTRDIQKRH